MVSPDAGGAKRVTSIADRQVLQVLQVLPVLLTDKKPMNGNSQLVAGLTKEARVCIKKYFVKLSRPEKTIAG